MSECSNLHVTDLKYVLTNKTSVRLSTTCGAKSWEDCRQGFYRFITSFTWKFEEIPTLNYEMSRDDVGLKICKGKQRCTTGMTMHINEGYYN
jgi:hypothetical protein